MKSTRPFELDQIATNLKVGEADRRPFVFVHGNTQNDTCGQDIIAYFSERGHTTLSYDLPGHGDSPLATKSYVFEDLIKLNQNLLQKFNLEAPILCGHSLGGMIQAGTIVKYLHKNASLILCGSFDGNPAYADNNANQSQNLDIKKSLEDYVAQGFQLFKRQKKYDYFTNRHLESMTTEIINLRYTDPNASKTNLETLGDFNVRQSLIDMKVPILVLHGEAETVIPIELVKQMVTAYPAIDYKWYPELGHYAFYQDTQLTRQVLDNCYKRIAVG